MKTLIPLIVNELRAGRAVAMATVLQARGSAPRGAGASQLLLTGGQQAGTVGGGVLERRALDEMAALLVRAADGVAPTAPPSALADGLCMCAARDSFARAYALTQDDVQSLGMVCGGNVTLLYQRLTPELLAFFEALEARLSAGRSLWLARCLRHGAVASMAWTDRQPDSAPGAGDALLSLCGRKALWTPDPGGAVGGVAEVSGWFTEPIMLASHAYVFGGGHVAQCVAPLLAQLDFAPIVYDDRAEFADPALFPGAAGVVCAPFTEMSRRLTILSEDAVVVMTRGHANDLQILTQALRTPAYYVGLIGSRSKIAHTRALLLAQGFAQTDFARVHTPIGLPIRAETPMEIAVSVAAEMILCRAERADARRSEADAPSGPARG